MIADYSTLLYSPVYSLLGVSAQLTPALVGSTPITITVLDKTAGVVINETIDIQTIRPAAAVRAYEILDQGVGTGDLDGGTLEFNEKTWRIDMHHMKPSPGGERSGEIMMFLIDESAYA